MEQMEYWIRPGQGKVIALIHGIGANDPQTYWQDFLSILTQDEQFREFGIFVWKYPTHVQPGGIGNALSTIKRKTLRQTAPRIALLGSAWSTTYHTQFQGYQDIALVCHSMGGLVVKSWILDTLERGQSTNLIPLRHVAFYATPHQGAPVTTLARWNTQLKDMQLNSPFIEDVDRRWYDHVVAWKERLPEPAEERFHRFIPHLVLAGLSDTVVPSWCATIRGMPLTMIAGDHAQVIQPIDRNDMRYKAWSMDLEKTYAIALQESALSSSAQQQRQQTHFDEQQRESKPVVQGQGQALSNTASSHVDTPAHQFVPAETSQPQPLSSTPLSPEKSTAISVFLVYTEKDEDLLRQLETHLSALQRNGLISLWHKRLIVPGTEWAREIDQQIERASLILLLVSADLLASDYHHQVEVKRALEQQKAGQAQVIPILLRPADWESTAFGHLHPLPSDRKPIVTWRSRDEAFLNVVEGIKQVIKAMQTDPPEPKGQTTQGPLSPSTRKKPGSFPPIWNVPYRYPAFFTGRDQVVEQLFDRFTLDPLSGSIPPWALTGLGGLGKTQTAVAYAYRHRGEYQSVLWANAETEGELVTSFTNMAKLLALRGIDLQQRESVLDGMQQWFTSITDWLLIVDNADDLVMVSRFLPTFASGHVLLTSRVAATGQEAQSLELSPLSSDDGALCLLRRANYVPWTGQLRDAPSSVSVKAAQELSERMGGLPLALEQAGAYIETTGRGVAGYLELYKKYRPEVQQHYYGDVRSYREAVAFAWKIASESVQLVNPAATELLYLCAYLSPDAIPYQLFPKDAHILGPTLGPVAAHPLLLDQIMTILRKHSLIQNQADRGTDISQIFIHRVLQEVLRDGMDPATQRLWAERAVRVVALALDEVEWSIIQAHAQQCLSHIEQWKMNFREADTIRQRFAVPHI